MDHRLDLFLDAAGHQQQVVARLQGTEAHRAFALHALHGQRVGKDQSLEAQLAGQQVVGDAARQGGGHVLGALDFGHGQMAHHDAVQPRLYHAAEGIELHAVEPLAREAQGGQGLVRVDVRVAMAGEMLAHGQDASVLEAAGIGHHLAGHLGGVFAEGAAVDDGIVGVDIDVGHGGKVDVDAHLATFAGHLASVFVEQAVVADATQHHVARKLGRVLQAHGQAPLAVQRNHQGNVGPFLGQVGEGHLAGHASGREEQAAHLVVLHDLAEQLHVGLRLRGGDGVDEELADALLQAQGMHDGVHPLAAALIVLEGVEERGFALRGGDGRHPPGTGVGAGTDKEEQCQDGHEADAFPSRVSHRAFLLVSSFSLGSGSVSIHPRRRRCALCGTPAFSVPWRWGRRPVPS